jgi:hypothetical protein
MVGVIPRLPTRKSMYRNLIVIFLASFSIGCLSDTAARGLVEEALDEMAWATRSQMITGELVALATVISPEQSLDKSAVELGTWVQSEWACANPTVDDEVVQLTLPDLSSGCRRRGETLSGEVAITIITNNEFSAEVEFKWNALTDGVVTVDGVAAVIWEHGKPWQTVTQNVDIYVNTTPEKVLTTEETFSVEPLQDEQGMTLYGTRCWTTDNGTECATSDGQQACLSEEIDCWSLDFMELEILWMEPIPQEGVHTFVNAQDEHYTFAYDRESEHMVKVTASDGSENYFFEVTTLGGSTE